MWNCDWEYENQETLKQWYAKKISNANPDSAVRKPGLSEGFETAAIGKTAKSDLQGLRKNPRFLLPFAPAIFKKTVAACERIAKEFSSRLKEKIDYSFFTATIEVRCCYVEFQRGEFMSILQEISNHAISVRFIPLTSGELHMEIVKFSGTAVVARRKN